MDLNVVYYIFINPERDWKIIVQSQLKDFKFCEIKFKKFYIHICCTQIILINECKQIIESFNFDNVVLTASFINQYEYPGLNLLYNVSKNSQDAFLYFHSKGMVFNNPTNERNRFEQTTLRATLFNWRRALTIFETVINVNKIGLWPSPQGYIWVNFFYIRGNTLKQPPKISTDRWYYEVYISESNEVYISEFNYFDCYSLTKDKICGIHADSIKDDNFLIETINCTFP